MKQYKIIKRLSWSTLATFVAKIEFLQKVEVKFIGGI